MKPNLLVAPFEEILADPRFFPVRVDFERDCLTLVETSRKRLAAAPFLDGRTPIAEGDAIELPLSAAIEAAWPRPGQPDRFLFNVAFCGSTLLSTLLDLEGYSFAAREPGILVDLANARKRTAPAVFKATLTLILALLRRSWRPGELNICKVSSWANTLVPLLAADPRRVRPLFLVTEQRSYLRAVFRGGRGRLEYVLKATQHLAHTPQRSSGLWAGAVSRAGDPLEIVARAALLSLDLQLGIFENAMKRGGWGAAQLMTFARLIENPVEACRDAAAAFELELPAGRLQESLLRHAGRHAKAPERAYLAGSTAHHDGEVERDYGAVMDRALDWAAEKGLKSDSLSSFPDPNWASRQVS